MACRIIDGRNMAAKFLDETKNRIAQGKHRPKLVTILAGDNPASLSYVKTKKKTCGSIGIETEIRKLDAKEDVILKEIEKLNSDKSVNGILVQLPLPSGINTQKVIEKIDPRKDVDGLHPVNIGRLAYGDESMPACTPSGIIKLLEQNDSIEGTNIVIVGRSIHVGKPLYSLLYNRNATVTMCHTKTKNLPEITRKADIVIVAVGKPKFLTADMIKDGAVVIDAGTSKVGSRLVGDADESIKRKAAAVTPVPGGVGPMTVAMLAKNTLDACIRQAGVGKEFIRAEMRRKLQAEKDIGKKSREISRRLLGVQDFKNSKSIFTYLSAGSEAQTDEIIQESIEQGKAVYCPAVSGDKIIAGLFDGQLVRGRFGMEPKQTTNKKDFDIIIVPGLAFDTSGARIGRGGGHFDRFLAEAGGKKIALAFDFQVVDKIYAEQHDVAVDLIITEKRTIRANKVIALQGNNPDITSL